MLGSPNYANRLHSGSSAIGDERVKEGCTTLEHLLGGYLNNTAGGYVVHDFGGSDYGPFIEVGIPSNGAEAGTNVKKTFEERSMFGGLVDTPYDPCYHRYCDSLLNINTEGLVYLSKATAFAVQTLATHPDLSSFLYPSNYIFDNRSSKHNEMSYALKGTNIKVLVAHIQESLYNIRQKRAAPHTIPKLLFQGPAQKSLVDPRILTQGVESKPLQATGWFGFLSSILPSPLPSSTPTVALSAPCESPHCIPLFGGNSSNKDFPCYGHVCHYFNGTLFLFGGMSSTANHCVQRFDMKLKQWLPPIERERKLMELAGEKNVGIPQVELSGQVEHHSAIVKQGVPTVHDPLLAAIEALALPPDLPPSQIPTSSVPVQKSELSRWVPSCFPATCNYRSLVYLFGGTVNDDTNDFFQFDMATLLWTSLNANCTTGLPAAKHGASLVYFHGNLYLFGGNSFTLGVCNTLHVYNTSNQEWHEILTEMAPPPRYHHNSFVTRNGLLIVYGGIAADNTKLDDVWSLNLYDLDSSPPKRKWEAITPVGRHPTPQRGNVGCFFPEHEKFVLVSSTNSNPSCEFFMLDLKNLSWTIMATQETPVAREFHSVTPIFDGSITVVVTSGMWRRLQSDVLGDAFCITLLPACPSSMLSDFCWLFVFSYLLPEDLCRLGRVSREFYRITGLNDAWLPHFPTDSPPSYFQKRGGKLKLLWIKTIGRHIAWGNSTPGVVKYKLPLFKEPETLGCFLGDGKVLLSDLSSKAVEDIQPGDYVMSGIKMKPRIVIEVRTRAVNSQYNLVFINNVGLTTGHPVLIDGKWTRPIDVEKPTSLFVGTMYDFVLDGGSAESDHSVIINGLTVCTLGNDCGEELRSKFPTMDCKYGTGFWEYYPHTDF
ncbi:hypothetical protein Pelo_5355 [Pelomyxa schiedti]|nr:hypothetical protein Pelo_5355 [Pelomyxa schiedti]